MTFKISGIALVLAIVAATVGWSGTISLSVAVGGVIGLANLYLWKRLVAGMVQHRQGEHISGAGLVVRMLFKVLPLIVFLAVIFRSPLEPLAVMVGFGSTLLGMLWAALFEARST